MRGEHTADSYTSLPTVGRRWRFSLRGLMILTAVASLYLAALVTLVRGLGGQAYDFAVVMILAVLAGTLIGTLVSTWAKFHQGRVLMRLRYRYEGAAAWFSPVWVPLIALVYVTAERCFLPPPLDEEMTWQHFTRLLLLVWTVHSAFFACSSIAQSLALCEKGICYRHGFVPWQRIAPGTLKLLDDTGNLVIHYGSWRIVAPVPPEQRAAVETLLNKKLRVKRRSAEESAMRATRSGVNHGKDPPTPVESQE